MENSLFHGIYPAANEGIIRISTRRQDDSLRITVEDNGVGFSAEKLKAFRLGKTNSGDEGAGSIGLNNIRERILYFYGDRGSLRIENLERSGARVTIVIPLQDPVA